VGGAGVENAIFDHTSLLKYLTDKWNLGPLGERTRQANSIGIAVNQSVPRDDTVPFIRVPYSNLIPDNSQIEKDDTSQHHEALYAFAWYLAKGIDSGTTDLVTALTKTSGFLVESKAMLGKLMVRVGAALSKDSDDLKKKRTMVTSDVARRVLRQGRRDVIRS
jgi:phospholipase C